MPEQDQDLSADTEAFQAFQDAADYRREHSNTFRIVSLLVGLAVLAAIIFALLQ